MDGTRSLLSLLKISEYDILQSIDHGWHARENTTV